MAAGEIETRLRDSELSRLRANRRLFTSADLARYLERQMAARDELQRGLRELEGRLYPFRQFRLDLAADVVAEVDIRQEENRFIGRDGVDDLDRVARGAEDIALSLHFD